MDEEEESVWQFSPFSKTRKYFCDKMECQKAVFNFCVEKVCVFVFVLGVLCVLLFLLFNFKNVLRAK